MKLRAYDTVHVTGVKADNIRPGEEFEISDSAGEDLLKAHPGLFAVLSRDADEKAAQAPQNKAEPTPENKEAPPIAAPRRAPARR